MNINYDKLANRDNGCIQNIKRSLKFNCNFKAGYVISLVMHAIRNSLNYTHSAEFIASLPTALKIIYVKDWKLIRTYIPIYSLNDLVKAINNIDSKKTFKDETDAFMKITITLRILNRHVNLVSKDYLEESFRTELSEILVEKINN